MTQQEKHITLTNSYRNFAQSFHTVLSLQANQTEHTTNSFETCESKLCQTTKKVILTFGAK